MIYLFNNQEELIKIINTPSIKALNQTETLTDEHLLDDRITAEVNALEEDLLQEIEYMAVKKQDADYQYSLYYVISATTEGNNTELYGVTAGFEELDKTIIEDKRPRNVIPRVAIDVALENTNWTAGFVGDVPNNSSHFYYISSLEAIKKICQSWGLEAEFVIEMNGSKIGARYINFYKQLGANEGKRVTYGHNALQIIQEDERTGIYTALIGRGKGELISGESENESGQAGYGRRITFEDVEWSVANGDPLNKPLGQKYLEIPDATATYGVKTPQGNRPKMGVVEFQEEEDPENLLKLTYQYLVETSRPLASFKTTPAYLNAGVGDVVRVVRYDRHLDYATRVFKVVTNRLTNKKVSVQLGDQLTQSAGRQQANLANQISGIISAESDDKLNQLLDYLPSATGKNTNFYGNEEPENPKVNDVWWKPNPEGESKPDWIMRWTGEVWERLDVTTEAIEQQFEEVEKQAQDLVDEIEASEGRATEKANQALQDAKAHAEAEDARIKQEVDGAIGLAEQAKQDAVDKANQALIDSKAYADAEVQASKEHFDSLIEEVESDVANAQATADSAVEQIDTAVANAGFASLDDTIQNISGIASGVKSELDIAIENAGFTSLDDTLQNMNDIASGIKSELDIAVQNAGFTSLDEMVSDTRYLGETANSNAQTAISEAQTARANSLTALGKADNALDGVSNLDIRVNDVEDELELKADNAFMTDDGELITLSNAITFNANRFSSDMQRIESRVESIAGEINLVILSDAFEGTRLVGNESYPNPSTGSGYSTSDTMREMIAVEEGEQLALSKQTVDIGYNWWTYNYYDDNYNYIGRSGTSTNEYVLTIPNGVSKLWVSYPKGSRPQIVRGTEFIPYRPNLADQMTSDEVRVFRNEYDEFAEGTQRRISAIDSTGGRLEIAETLITQTAEGLLTTVGKVNDHDTRLATVEHTADGLQATVLNKASISQVTQIAEGLDVLVKSKPKNVINNGDFSDGYVWWSFGTNIIPKKIIENRLELDLTANSSAISGNLNRIWNVPQLQSGRKYRVTFDAYTYTSGRVISIGQANSNNMEEVALSNDVHSYEVVFEADRNASLSIYLHEAGTYEIGNIVVVETSAISQAQISVLSDSITSTISTLDGRVSEQKQALDNISSTVYDEHAEKIATQQLTIDGLQTTVSDKANQSQVTQLAEGLNTLVQSKPKSIINNGDFSNGWSYWTFGTGIDFYGVEENRVRVWLHSSNQTTIGNVNRIFNNERFLSGRKYRVTFDASCALGATTTKEISVGQTESTRNQKVTITETLRSYEVIYHADRNGPISFYLHNWGQYEIGNIEVVETNQISQAQISVLSDGITQSVSDLDGRVTEQKQTLDSIVSTVSDVQEDAEGTTTLLNQTVSTVESQSTTLATIRTDLDGKATVTAFNTLENTVDGAIQRIGNAEGNITQIEANVNGLQTTVASKANQSEVTQLATGLNALVQSKTKSIALNGDFSSGRSYWTMGTDIDFYSIVDNRMRVWLHSSSQSTSGNVNRVFNNGRFLSGRKYRVTFDAFGASGSTSITTKDISVGQSDSTRNQKVTITETLRSYEVIYHADRNGPISFYLHNWGQYEIGNIEVVETNQISQAQISVLSDSITQSVGNLDGKIATQQLAIDGLQTIVSDKANQSQVTQLATGLNALVQSKPKSIINNGDFSDGYVWWSFGTNITAKEIVENRLELDLTTDSSAISGNLNRIWNVPQLQNGRKYRVTFDAYTYTSGGAISVGQASSNNMEEVVLSNEVRSYEVIYEADRNASLSIYFHHSGTYEIGNIEVVETNQVSQAQLSVLNNNINLRVSKGELLSQINIEAERTLIQSNKLVLDSESVLFTGSAFIPSAQIQSVHADKINAGTIDSARINATEIITNGLTTDVIKSDHIETSTATIDKLFANDAMVDRLWAKDIWTNKITAMELDASQITAGEIETARLKTTEIVSQGLSGNEDSVTQLVIDDDLYQSSVTNLAQQKVADELTQEYETVEGLVELYRLEDRRTLTAGTTFKYTLTTLPFDIESGKEYVVEFEYPTTTYDSYFYLYTGDLTLQITGNHTFRDPDGQIKITFNADENLPAGDELAIAFIDGRGVEQLWVENISFSGMKEMQVPVVGGNTGAISSQITQLYNMINLSILGEDGAMSRIAMGEQGIQIDGKLLHITARTYIDDAVIKSAMIDTLDAGKITTGELNASLIRVTNLDANSISGNEASFISAMFSGTESTLQITGSGVNVLDNAGRSSTKFGVYGMDFYRNGTHLGALEYATNVSETGDLSGFNGITLRPQPTSHFSVSYYMPVSERPAYSSTTTYSKGDIVRYNSTAYISRVASNRGNTPSSGLPNWEVYTGSTRSLSVNGRNGNIYMANLIKPSEQQDYGIHLTWGNITGVGTNVRIMNHNRTGGVQINNGDLSYLTSGGWRSLNEWLE